MKVVLCLLHLRERKDRSAFYRLIFISLLWPTGLIHASALVMLPENTYKEAKIFVRDMIGSRHTVVVNSISKTFTIRIWHHFCLKVTFAILDGRPGYLQDLEHV